MGNPSNSPYLGERIAPLTSESGFGFLLVLAFLEVGFLFLGLIGFPIRTW
jgi:hypothetical protein